MRNKLRYGFVGALTALVVAPVGASAALFTATGTDRRDAPGDVDDRHPRDLESLTVMYDDVAGTV